MLKAAPARVSFVELNRFAVAAYVAATAFCRAVGRQAAPINDDGRA